MNRVTATSTATSTQPSPVASNGEVQVPAAHIAEQSITAFGLAEIVTDSDTGQSTLCVSADQCLADYRDASVSQAAALARQLREKADRIDALAGEYAEKVVIPEFCREFSIDLEEYDTSSVFADAPEMADTFNAFCEHRADGSFFVAVPAGQKPIRRLAVIRDLVLHFQAKADAA